MNRALPLAFKKLSSKQRAAFYRNIKVDLIPDNFVIAEENKLLDPKNIQIVVSGSLWFFKRSENFYEQKSQFGYSMLPVPKNEHHREDLTLKREARGKSRVK